jgi:hypothetical protein
MCTYTYKHTYGYTLIYMYIYIHICICMLYQVGGNKRNEDDGLQVQIRGTTMIRKLCRVVMNLEQVKYIYIYIYIYGDIYMCISIY